MQQMLANLRARREDERGFTLIELMVVVLIIAILIAIAIPTFLGAKTRAQDKAAQSSLRNALTNAKGIYTDTDSYVGASTTALLAAEPSLTFAASATASTGPKNVSVNNGSAAWIAMASKSQSGVCFAIADGATGPGTVFAKWDSSATACSASNAPAAIATVPTDANAAIAGTDWAQAW